MSNAESLDHAAALDRLAGDRSSIARRSNLLALARFLVFIGILVAGGAVAATPGVIPILATALAIGVFLLLALIHASVLDARTHIDCLADYHTAGVKRLAGQFPRSDTDYRDLLSGDERHPYAEDVDVVGQGGLLAHLDTCGSQLGRRSLGALLVEADHAFDPKRAESVAALAERHGWRADLYAASAGRGDRDQESPDGALASWLLTPPPAPNPALAVVSIVLAVAAILLALAAFTWLGGQTGFLALVLLVLALTPVNDWAFVRLGLQIDADYESRRLQSLAAGLGQVAALGSGADERLDRLVSTATAGHQPLVRLRALIDGFARRNNPLWRFGVGALILSEWRQRQNLHRWAAAHGANFAEWCRTLGEAEALASLATWAAEQGGCWPEQVAEGPHLQAENIAHPLIHKDRRIGNDCAITGGDVLLLTGANASGKSTLLRSLALSLLLARAGTTVPAASFRFRPQRLVTVMRVSDDLEAGRSRFQAEVRALAEAVQRAGTAGDPVLVILDEILGGTNSHERHLGTEAIITHLLDAPGPVLVSTHDLELPALAERFPGRVQLAHFADGAGEEDLSFDYRLRPGVITSTNALKVMRLAGLPV